jgi:hypothetical protein
MISKKLEKIIFIVILKVTGKRSRIRVREFGSIPKCHGSRTLYKGFLFFSKAGKKVGFNAVLRIRDILVFGTEDHGSGADNGSVPLANKSGLVSSYFRHDL